MKLKPCLLFTRYTGVRTGKSPCGTHRLLLQLHTPNSQPHNLNAILTFTVRGTHADLFNLQTSLLQHNRPGKNTAEDFVPVYGLFHTNEYKPIRIIYNDRIIQYITCKNYPNTYVIYKREQ